MTSSLLTLYADNIGYSEFDSLLFERQSFSLHSGEILLVSSNNEQAVTAFLNIICGTLAPQHGSLLFNQRPVYRQLEYYQHMTMPLLNFDDHVVNQTVAEYIKRLCDEDNNDDHACEKVLSYIGLKEFEAVKVNTLSKPQLAQLYLANLLTNQQEIWIIGDIFIHLVDEYKALFGQLISLKLQHNGIIIFNANTDMNIDEGIGMSRLDISLH